MNSIENKKFFCIPVSVSSQDNILKFILKRLSTKGQKTFVVTPNPEIFMLAKRDASYRRALFSAHVALPDGTGLVIAARMFGIPVQKRISGADFMLTLCDEASKRGLTVGFLGGRGNVAEKCAVCLKNSYPNLTVRFAVEEWDEVKEGGHVDILFVAYGSPKQEKWIYENLFQIHAGCVMGVGGAFDFVSGRVRRAPSFVRRIGFEWLYRLLRQPWRWRRQLSLVQFAMFVLGKKVFGR